VKGVPLTSVAAKGGLVGGPFGSSLVGNDYRSSGVPVIRGTNMGDTLTRGPYVFVDANKAEELGRNNAVPGDLVFTQRGTLGQVCIAGSEYPTYVISQSQMRLRVDTARFEPRFVLYACKTAGFRQQIDDSAIATGVPHINLGILGRLKIPELIRAEQAAIAEVLGALDDKIAANRALITASERLASATFAHFVRPESRPLSELADFVNGRNFTKDATGTGRVVIRIAELNSGLSGSTVWNEVDAVDANIARAGDLLFAWSGSLTVHRWHRAEGLVNQHIFKVIPKAGFPIWLVHQLLLERLAAFRAIAADKATTMGHIQRHHLDVEVRVPTDAEIVARSPLMQGLWDRSLAADVESEQLAQLRDTLLPELMSGRLRVREAERAVEEVL